MSMDMKTEVVDFPNGTRRESMVYPNGVRMDRLHYPNGLVKESITNERPVPHYLPNPNRRHSSPMDGHNKVAPTKANSFGATPARKESGPARRRSLIDLMAPPMTREEIPKCCIRLNIRIAAFIIGFIEFALLAVALYGISHWYMDTSSDPEISNRRSGGTYRPTISRTGLVVGSVVSVIIFFLTILLMFLGLWKRKTNCIVPHMVIQAFSILCAIGGIVVTSIAIGVMRPKINGNGDNDDDDLSDRNSLETYYFCVGILVFSIFVFIFELYAFLVIRNCARFFNVEEPEVTNEEMMEHVMGNPWAPPAWNTAIRPPY